MGLTIKGIHILRDEKEEFKKYLEKYNKNKLKELPEIEEAKKKLKDSDVISFFNMAIKIINNYNLDSQGFFEYMRVLIEDAGFKIEKIWKEDKINIERRYERCLYFSYKKNTYLLDSITKSLDIVNLNDLDKNLFVFNSEHNEYKYYGG